jgi:hypothetical protein
MLRLQALLRQLLEHADSYTELGAAALAEYRSAWRRRLVWLLVGAVTGIAALATMWATGLVALWETPWRLAYVAGSAMVLLVISGAALHAALARGAPGPSAGLLRSELRKDMELWQQWKRTL